MAPNCHSQLPPELADLLMAVLATSSHPLRVRGSTRCAVMILCVPYVNCCSELITRMRPHIVFLREMAFNSADVCKLLVNVIEQLLDEANASVRLTSFLGVVKAVFSDDVEQLRVQVVESAV